MKIINKIKYTLLRLFQPFLTNKFYLEQLYLIRGNVKKLNLNNPITFNDKLNWLKLNDIHEEYTNLVDKIEVKKVVAEKIGEEYIIPTLVTYDNPEQIKIDELPNQFVLKANHYNGVYVCKNKANFDLASVQKKLKHDLRTDLYSYDLEYPYKNVRRRILAEQYMEDESGFELKDYKFFCFNGEPKFLFIATGRQIGDIKFDFFDLNFNHIPVIQGHPNSEILPKKPDNFDKMISIAAKLSVGIPHVRVDLYNVNGRIYFGEFTFFHFSGSMPFIPDSFDYEFGKFLHLPTK